MTIESLTPPEIRQAGMQALVNKLGLAGTIRFLQQFDPGCGDYTADRQRWLQDCTVQQIVESVEKTPD